MEFPNGFENWYETFFEVVSYINERETFYDNNEGNHDVEKVYETEYTKGRGGLYLLAQEWTDEFELLNKGREWDGEFYDEIDEFLIKKNLHEKD